MLKKTITYTDFNDKKRTEDFYFNFSKAELAEMELTSEAGLTESLKKIVQEEDKKKIVEFFKDFVIKAYGVKSDDGKRFIKSKEVKDSFVESNAYSELFMELASDANAAADFVNGVIPQIASK